MSREARVAALERFWSLVNARDLDAAVELYAEHAVIKLAGRPVEGREAIKGELASLIAAFPDIRYTTGRRWIDGDAVVEEWSASGTHRGDFLGCPATGNAVKFEAVTIYQFDGAQVTRDWTYTDMSSVLVRTGFLCRAGS